MPDNIFGIQYARRVRYCQSGFYEIRRNSVLSLTAGSRARRLECVMPERSNAAIIDPLDRRS